MLRGAELSQSYVLRDGVLQNDQAPQKLWPGDVIRLSPNDGDIHQVSNGIDQPSISIHVYGADIGAIRRSVFTPDGASKPFISGYANTVLPNIWGNHD